MILFAHQITGPCGKKPDITRMCVCKVDPRNRSRTIKRFKLGCYLYKAHRHETRGTGKRLQVLIPAAKSLLEMIVVDSAVFPNVECVLILLGENCPEGL